MYFQRVPEPLAVMVILDALVFTQHGMIVRMGCIFGLNGDVTNSEMHELVLHVPQEVLHFLHREFSIDNHVATQRVAPTGDGPNVSIVYLFNPLYSTDGIDDSRNLNPCGCALHQNAHGLFDNPPGTKCDE